jgi:hypothetical protein
MTSDELRKLADDEESVPYNAEYRTSDIVIDALREAAAEIDRLTAEKSRLNAAESKCENDQALLNAIIDVDCETHAANRKELASLHQRVAELERFAAELWMVDQHNARSTSESEDEELAAWAKGMIAQAEALGITHLVEEQEKT